jgi:hypothetical protein
MRKKNTILLLKNEEFGNYGQKFGLKLIISGLGIGIGLTPAAAVLCTKVALLHSSKLNICS